MFFLHIDDISTANNVNDFEPPVYKQTMDGMAIVIDVNANLSGGLWTKPTYRSSLEYLDSDYEEDKPMWLR